MTDLAERRQRFAADPLGRRLGGDQFGVFGLQGLEFTEQPVVFRVGNRRLVEHVVAVVVGVDLAAQGGKAFGGGLGVGH